MLYSRLDLGLNGKSLCCESSFSGLFQHVHSVNREQYTVTVYITMAADGRPVVTIVGSGFETYSSPHGTHRSPS